MLSFVLVLLLLWVPGLVLCYGGMLLARQNLADPEIKNTVSILTMGWLAIEFFVILPWWGRKVYNHPNLFYRYGLVVTRRNGSLFIKGLAIGISFTFALFISQGLLGWLTWQSSSMPLPQLLLGGAASALGVALGEELFFRGWMLDELDRDYQPLVSLTIDSTLFALLHFLKPIALVIQSLPEFPGLFLLGTLTIVAKRHNGNLLGMSIGLHAGLVWIYYLVNVGKLVKYTERVPNWITGINGNPISGIHGVIFLTILIIGISKLSPRLDFKA
jgi:membrane protease YdiL (CAAX protease family)